MISNFQRNRAIIKDGKTMTGAELAEKYSLSKTRISQILSRTEHVCEIHGKRFYTACRDCSKTKLRQDAYLDKHPELEKMLATLSKSGRDADSVAEKKKIVRSLHKKGFSVSKLSDLLAKHHSTILHYLR